MHAVTIVDGALEWREHPDPEPGAGEVAVAVRAAGISNADLLQRAGFYPPPPGAPRDIPGLEAGGVTSGDPSEPKSGTRRETISNRVKSDITRASGGCGQARRAPARTRRTPVISPSASGAGGQPVGPGPSNRTVTSSGS